MENEKVVFSVVAALLVVVGLVIGLYLAQPETVVEQVEVPVIEVVEKPTVEQIEVPVEDPRVDVLLDNMKRVRKLKNDAEEAALDELDEDHLEDLLVALGLDVDEVEDYKVDNDETEVEVLSYDFDNEDEDKALVTLKVKVYYTLEEGVDDDFKKVLYVTGVYSLDDGDEEFEFE